MSIRRPRRRRIEIGAAVRGQRNPLAGMIEPLARRWNRRTQRDADRDEQPESTSHDGLHFHKRRPSLYPTAFALRPAESRKAWTLKGGPRRFLGVISRLHAESPSTVRRVHHVACRGWFCYDVSTRRAKGDRIPVQLTRGGVLCSRRPSPFLSVAWRHGYVHDGRRSDENNPHPRLLTDVSGPNGDLGSCAY